jgi:hypothetical protein
MWRTSIGTRVLRGPEWELFLEGLGGLRDRIEMTFDDADAWPTGVDVFDRLVPASKLAMLAAVGKALSDEAVQCPPLTALTEGTFAAVYAVIRELVDLEIDACRENSTPEAEDFSVRTLVLAATRQTNPLWDDPTLDPDWEDDGTPAPALPEPGSEDVTAWSDLVEELMDRVLWEDRDFDEEAAFVDKDPRFSADLKAYMGIDKGYFSAIAPDPSDSELAMIRQTLAEILGRPGEGL